MAGEVSASWNIQDGATHNFSPACSSKARKLFVSAVPGGDVPGWGLGEADMGLRMMSMTSWLDLMHQCKIKHVVCTVDAEELSKKFDGLCDGNFEKTCAGAGMAYHHCPMVAATWPSPPGLAECLRVLRGLPDEHVVICCSDGRRIAPAVSAAWIALSREEAPSAVAEAVEQCAASVGCSRYVLQPFTEKGGEEAFSGFAEEVRL
eukprot:TRINITY_DN103223_c0_g1_i1.p1 TRINITY_DN103223_c0_g1~~TRINITY_DN103223_c0_g1_i1.p1  ORF type:complete len:205 (-),score=41.26 TRINITY_DN103223_c0_g1_i1:23-637(-)